MTKQTFYGLSANPRICRPGVIDELSLVPADANEHWMAEELLDRGRGVVGLG